MPKHPRAVACQNEKHRRSWVRPLRAPLASLLTVVTLSTTFAAPPAEAHAVQYNLDIPAQSLDSALQAFALVSHHRLLYKSPLVEGQSAPALKGEFTTEEAIKKLLSGTQLTFNVTPSAVVLIRPKSDKSATAEMTSTRGSADTGQPGKGGSAQEKSFWNGFRMAQVDPGQNPSTGPVSSSRQIVDAGQSQSLEEITVTATRRAESASKVPISMTALSQQTMDDLHVESVADLASIVPGLSISPPSATLQDHSEIAIRGIYNLAFSTAPTTEIYLDETPIATRELAVANSKSPFPNIFDLERVEVLRGPQGTLFGASAMGGAIRFVTPDPSLNSTSGFAKGELGYTQGGGPVYELGAAYGAPIVSDVAGFRVSAWYQSLAGFIDREDPYSGQIIKKNANASDSYVVRPGFELAPSDKLKVTAAFYLQHQYDQSPNGYWSNDLPNPEANEHVWGGFAQPGTDDLRVASLGIKYSFDGLLLQSDTSYLNRKSEIREDTTRLWTAIFAPYPQFPESPLLPPSLSTFQVYEQNNSSTTAWQQEVRLSSQASSSRLYWVAGVFYRTALQTLQQLQPDITPLVEYSNANLGGIPNYVYNGQSLSGYGYYSTRDVSTAAFADATFDVTARLKLDAGVRVERDAVEGQSQFVAGPVNAGTALFTPSDAVARPVTPRVSFQYQVTDTDMLYVSAAKGFRPGGGNNLAGVLGNSYCRASLQALGFSTVPETFRPDSLWSYELGTKDLMLDRRLSIEASVYYVRWTQIQNGETLTSCGQNITLNQGTAVSRGFDLQVAATITPNLSLRAYAGYTDAYFPNAAYGPPPVDSNGQPSGPPPLLNVAGDKIPNVVPWTVAANAQYKRRVEALGNGAESYIRVDYRWLSAATPFPSFNPDIANYDPETSPYPNAAYGLLNLRLGVLYNATDVSAYVNNVTNTDPRLGYAHDVPGSPLFYGNAIRPRTFGLTLWYHF